MTSQDVAQEAPVKSYFIVGTNWHCYVEPSETDAELSADDLAIEVCTKAIESFFGLRPNETLTIIDEAVEPMIGVMVSLTEKGKEGIEDSYNYVPSFFPLANCGRYKDSAIAEDAYTVFTQELAAELKKPKKGKKVPPQPPKNLN